ncbi:UIF factor, partial [Atractosteus spatula]|nr:UIF factor [Atractosteus spatula]
MGDSIVDPAPMEVECNSEKIDMSLDDIIKLNKNEQKSNQEKTSKNNRGAATTRKKLVGATNISRQQRIPFRRVPYQAQQGPYYLRSMGQDLQGFKRRIPYNLRKASLVAKGVSPLNRNAWNTQGKQAVRAFESNSWGQRFRQQTSQPQFRKRFWQTFRGPPTTSRSIPMQYRGQRQQQLQYRQKQERHERHNINRGFSGRNNNRKSAEGFQKGRSWRQTQSSGSILTVEVPNSVATPGTVAKRPSLLKRSTQDFDASPPQPKGIPLRFNFKAIANQTKVTLNERFTFLKIRGSTAGPQRGRRTVTLQ